MSSVSRGLRTVTGQIATSCRQQHDPMDAAAAGTNGCSELLLLARDAVSIAVKLRTVSGLSSV